jgi:hypothetical protein
MKAALLISGISVFLALVGVTFNAFKTVPYTGVANLIDENETEKHERTGRQGRIANYLIALGTLGQFVSILCGIIFGY